LVFASWNWGRWSNGVGNKGEALRVVVAWLLDEVVRRMRRGFDFRWKLTSGVKVILVVLGGEKWRIGLDDRVTSMVAKGGFVVMVAAG
jgi:hypothetical protein